MTDPLPVPLPPEFWKDISMSEFGDICERGYLNAEQCKRLYRLLGRKDKPPKRLVPMVNTADLLRLFPPKA
jgi:hypothetical protein